MHHKLAFSRPQKYVVSDAVTRIDTTLESETVTMRSEDQNNEATLILTTFFVLMVFSRAPMVHAMKIADMFFSS